MAILNILQFPDPRLKLVAKEVEAFDQNLSSLCADMLETMYTNQGIGLASTQVNIQQRIFVMDLSDDQTQPLIVINPKIISATEQQVHEEGCLSFPGVFAKVTRAANITLEYFTPDQKRQTLSATDLMAVCIQHEIDHLDGITFYDHLSPLKQQMLRKKLDKLRDRVS